MIAEALLAELAALGVTAETDGELLRLRPAALVSPELADLIRPRKRELVAILERRELEGRVLAVLRAGEVHTTRSLALRLGIPVPRPGEGASLFVVLGDLLDRREIATDPKTLTFRFRAPGSDPPPPHGSRTKGDAP